MSNLYGPKIRLPVSIWLSSVIALTTLLLPIEKAPAQDGCGNFISGSPVISPVNGSKVIVGQTITITRFTVVSAGGGTCPLANGAAFYAAPDGAVTKVMEGFNLDPGQAKDCTGTPGNNDAACLGFASTYVVNAADLNRTLTIVMPPSGRFGGATVTDAGAPNEIHFFGAVEAEGFNPNDATSSTGAGSSAAGQRLIVVTPGISITKVCVNPCTPYGDPILFRGTICNTGDVRLINITVTDAPAANIAFAATKSNGQPFNPGTGLAAGECIDYTGSYQPAGTGGTSLCGPFNSTVTAGGTAQGVFQNPRFTNTASATCQVCPSLSCPGSLVNPRIDEGSFWFSFATETDQTYTIESSDSLSPANWQTLMTIIGDGGVADVEDTITNGQRFYRVKIEIVPTKSAATAFESFRPFFHGLKRRYQTLSPNAEYKAKSSF